MAHIAMIHSHQTIGSWSPEKRQQTQARVRISPSTKLGGCCGFSIKVDHTHGDGGGWSKRIREKVNGIFYG